MAKQKYEIGMIGPGVMGRNLVLNIADHGFSVSSYDIDLSKVQELQAQHDDFGDHSYERVDGRGNFHPNWEQD
jgi:6-phosphogluconate dehydrogenase